MNGVSSPHRAGQKTREHSEMRRILAATDFSGRSERAIRRAGLLAKKFGAEIVLAHVVDDDRPKHMVQVAENEATAALENTVRSLSELSGCRCDVRIVRGDAFDGIVRLTEAVAADLVVMGTHRRQLLKDVLVGTTLERVIRMRPAPVLVVNSEPLAPYLGTLIAVDLSECSGRALRAAVSLGLLAGTRTTILHVFDPMAKGMLATAGVPAEKIKAYVAEAGSEASLELTRFLKGLDLGGVEYATRVQPEEGPPGRMILEVASYLSPDLVVIGTHGRTGIAKLFLGSVAQELLKALETDVLVVAP